MTRKTVSKQLTKEEEDYLRAILAPPAPGSEADSGKLTISGHGPERGLLSQFVGSKSVQLRAEHDGLTLISELQLQQDAFTQQVSLHLAPPSILDNNGTPRNLRVCTTRRDISLQDAQHLFADAQLLDISVTGASIATALPAALQVGDVLAPLRLGVKGCKPVLLAGKVVRIAQQHKPSGTVIGIHFLGHTKRSRKILNEYVFQHRAATPEVPETDAKGNDLDTMQPPHGDA